MKPLPPAQPPIRRGAMVPVPWAGHPLLRPFRKAWPMKRALVLDDPRPMRVRRVVLLALILASASFGTNYMVEIVPQHGTTWIELGLLLLFGLLFGWISSGFWVGLMGAWVLLRGKRRPAIVDPVYTDPAARVMVAQGPPRTAVIMPICNEHVPTVFAGLRATFESLRATGKMDGFDFFVLSDTYDPDLRVAEQAAFSDMKAVVDEGQAQDRRGGRFFYRWRQQRTKRKSGNVADFCRRWGPDYRYMIVLDADSVMTGECLNTLVRLMEEHPDSGIIQTAPRASGHVTAHARSIQFSSGVYGPLFTAGLNFWQLGESHYWGHNAILRIAPFMEHCALAALEGKTSLSGEIMSHDFVEAALMRRAGWKVWIAHDLDGSYEQVPPSLLDELQRDRRWCLGNLQNSRLMFEPGFSAPHRSVFFTGALAYASAPLWFGFLLFSTLLFAQHVGDIPTYFHTPYQMFPTWPTNDLRLVLTLFGATLVLLLGPKLLALTVIILKGESHKFGGLVRLLVSAVLEFLYTVLLAPVRMLFHTRFVIAPLMGLRSGWTSPPRSGDATPWGEAIRRNGVHTLLAVAWVGGILTLGESFPWWLSPVIAGLLLAAPIAVWASWSSIGLGLRRAGLLLIPEEQHEPLVLQETRRYEQSAPPDVGFIDAVTDERVRAKIDRASPAREYLGGLKASAARSLVARGVAEGPDALKPKDRLRVLSDIANLNALAAGVQGDEANPSWIPLRREARVQADGTSEPAGDSPAEAALGTTTPAALSAAH